MPKFRRAREKSQALTGQLSEYVKVCSLYGAGFFYIPGTDTCIKIGGFVRVDYAVYGSGSHVQYYNGAGGAAVRSQDDYRTRMRSRISVDTRTQTEYGTLRSYFQWGFQSTTGTDTFAGGSASVGDAFIQFAGFTFGKAVSFFGTPWNTYPANYSASLFGSNDNSTMEGNLIAYTAQLGNGLTATLSLEDNKQSMYPVWDRMDTLGLPGAAPTDSAAGGSVPLIVGNLTLTQAWGVATIAGMAKEVRATYYGATETTGHPGDKWGWGITGGIQLNLPWAKGDALYLSAGYTEGAPQFLLGGQVITNFGAYSGNSLFVGNAFEAVFDSAGGGSSLELTRAFGFNGALQHYWTPSLRSSIFGAYTSIDYNGNATAMYCAAVAPGGSNAANWFLTAGSTCNPDFNIWQVGTRTIWNPVANLDIGLEILYTKLETKHSGTISQVATNNFKPAGLYSASSEDVWSGMLRVQRNFWP